MVLLVYAGALAALFWIKPWLPRHEGTPIRTWVHEAINGDQDKTAHQAEVVSKVLRERAVPDFIHELDSMRPFPLRNRLAAWQRHLPRWAQFMKDGPFYEFKVRRAADILLDMGDAAEPAIPALVRSIKANDIPSSEFVEIIWNLHWMGPRAKAAIPLLRALTNRLEAAVAIYAIDGSTDAVVDLLSHDLTVSPLRLDYRELWWHRMDEAMTEAIAPLLCSVLTDETRSVADRRQVAEYLGELVTENEEILSALRLVKETGPAPELRQAAVEALVRLENNREREAGRNQ